MRKKIFLLTLASVAYLYLFSQSDFTISINPTSLHMPGDSIGKLNLSITNDTDTSLNFPSRAFLVDKQMAWKYEIGIEYNLKGQNEKLSCAPALSYALNPDIQIVTIRPKETKMIKATLLGGCFFQKGVYVIKFYIRKSHNYNASNQDAFYSSNSIELTVF